jgi:L,D-peptidoglycan transpeptidase YkuD (ErfK/YbiS/YcfS/YnhG family)
MQGLVKNKPFKIKIIALIFSILLIVLSFIALSESLAPDPPLAELNEARIQMEIARKENAEKYSPNLYQKAEKSWQLAQQAWKLENKKWSFNRNFQEVKDLAKMVGEQAELAKIRSREVQDSLHPLVLGKLSQVKKQISDYLDKYESVTTKISIKKRLIQGEQSVREGEIALQTRDYFKAIECFETAEGNIKNAESEMARVISEYFSQIPKWEQWMKASIEESNLNQSEVIIVNKMEHYLDVYRNGILLAQFDIEMGSNWIGRKQVKGDKATPEGHYFIVKKRVKPKTIYHKALELNYPNIHDEELFYENLENGDIPLDAEIGGSIEIHGEGGTGSNWTDGCIALRNSDMDSLFNLVEEGTPVTIIGTLKKKIPRVSR